MSATDRYMTQAQGKLGHEVRSVMTPGVVTIPADASLKQVYRALDAHRVHAVLVVERDTGAPLGWISAGGLLSWVTKNPDGHTAGQAICQPVHTISPSAALADAVEVLLQPGVSHVLVARHGATSAEGVLTDTDVVRLMSGR